MEKFKRICAGPWVEILIDHEKKREMTALLALALFSCPPTYAQRQSQGSAAQAPGTEASTHVLLRAPDIISDNLDRVAASADQILEVLSREGGLMVEFKRLLSKDAGASGQILEESDL